MTYSGAIPAQSTPSEAASKEETKPIEKNECLSWKGRHVDLKPKCCQRNSVRKAVGILLLGLGVALAGCAVLAALTFVALPGTVIGVTATLAALGGTFFIAGFSISLLPRSWNDPATRIRVGKQAADRISKNNLSYNQIRQQYGTQIDRYQILSHADLNLLLRKDLSRESSTYETLILRHGKELLTILDEENQKVMRQKFLAFLTPPISIKTILDHAVDVKALKITAEEISALLEPYIETLDYEDFLEKFGIDLLANDWIYTPEGRDPSKLLSEEARETLKLKFLEFLKTKDISLVNAKKIFVHDITLLQVTEGELICELTNRDLKKTLKGEMRYLDFLKGNDGNGIRGGNEELLNTFRTGLLNEIRSDEIGMAELQEKYQPELDALTIENSDLAGVTIYRDLPQLERGTLNYLAFRKNHGLGRLEIHLREKRPVARQAFLNMPYSSMKAAECRPDCTYLRISDQDIFDSVKRDLNSLSYDAFKLKHGLAWIKDPLCTQAERVIASSQLISKLQHRPYSEIKPFLNDFAQLNTSSGQLAQLMEGEFTTSFKEIIQKHGKEWLAEVPAFTTDPTLKQQLATSALDYVLSHANAILTNSSAHGSLLLEHHLLTQSAEKSVYQFKRVYETKVKETNLWLEGVKAHNQECIQKNQRALSSLESTVGGKEENLKRAERSYQQAHSHTKHQYHTIEGCVASLNQARQLLTTLQREIAAPGNLMKLKEELRALQHQKSTTAATPVKGLGNAKQAQNQILELQKRIKLLETQINHIETLPYQLATTRNNITRLERELPLLRAALPELEITETRASQNYKYHQAEVEIARQQLSEARAESAQLIRQIQSEERDAEAEAQKELREEAKKLAVELKKALHNLK